MQVEFVFKLTFQTHIVFLYLFFWKIQQKDFFFLNSMLYHAFLSIIHTQCLNGNNRNLFILSTPRNFKIRPYNTVKVFCSIH